MLALTKNEILNCLENVSRQIENICQSPNIPIKNFLVNLNIVDLRVYLFISKLRYLSYYEDAFIDDILNGDIDLSQLREKIFIDKNTKNKFSNKQIIKYIRNAFSHSDNEKELYKISINGRFLEIHLKQTKPCEFHIKMSFSDLTELINNLESMNFYLSKFEDNKLKRYYLKAPIDKRDYKGIYKQLDEKRIIDEREYTEAIIEYYANKKTIYETREYSITDEQEHTIKKYDKLVHKLAKSNNEFIIELLNNFRNYELSKIIPLQEEKLTLKSDIIFFIILLCEYQNYSFNQLQDEFINTGYNLFNQNPLNEIQETIHNNIGTNPARLFLFNSSDLIQDTYMEYISYYIMNICNEEFLIIDGKKLNKENIRNSLAHGRWFIDQKNDLILCDAKNGKYNDYNFYWREKIKLYELFKMIYQGKVLKIRKK